MTPDNEHIPIDLHMHWTRWEGMSLLMSRDGIRGSAHHIPKALILDPMNVSTILLKVGNETSRKGQFRIEKWKLAQLGWLQSENKDQGRLAL